ncbi:MAG: tRNA dihydrouridine synthase [Acidobacteriaceae bacterium]
MAATRKNFWQKLKKPIIALAPMADVTDAAFRRILVKYGKPDVLWTEFVSADGLCSDGRQHLLLHLKYTQKEHPIIAQIFGSDPQKIKQAARIIQDLKFDGLDINMGCPDRKILKQGAGAELIKDFYLAKQIIRAAKQGAPKIPISVKTRIGYNRIELKDWLINLLEEEVAAITIHGRTKKELSLVPAHWDSIAEAVNIARKFERNKKHQTIILGNGDVTGLKDAFSKIKQSGVDGIMIGRGVFGNPWVFNKKRLGMEPTIKEKLNAMAEHTKLFEKLFKEKKSFNLMKKFFKAYVADFPGAGDLRKKLYATTTAEGVSHIVRRALKDPQIGSIR